MKDENSRAARNAEAEKAAQSRYEAWKNANAEMLDRLEKRENRDGGKKEKEEGRGA